MQGFSVLNATDYVKDSRQAINDNFAAVISDFSGTVFPTNNLTGGMKCNRTDRKKVYVLQQDLLTWTEFFDYNNNKITVPNAANATNATNALNDGNGDNISETYLKEAVTNISESNGAISVTKSSGNITTITQILKAIQDGNGNNIVNTYATKTNLNAKAPLANPTFTGSPKAPTPNSDDNSTKIATTAFVRNVANTTIPTGTILPFAGNSIPSGFLSCNGAAISRTTYSALYAAIGTKYGSGNGSSTFNLPEVSNGRLFTSAAISIAQNGDFSFDGTGVNTSDGTYHGSSYGATYKLTNAATFNMNVGSTKNSYSTFGVGVLPNTKQNTSGGSWSQAPLPFKYKSGLKINMPSYVSITYCIKY